MKTAHIILFLIASLLLSGCLSSPNPFYTDADIFQDDRFLGDYRDKETGRGYLVQHDMDVKGHYHIYHFDGPVGHAHYMTTFIGTLFRIGEKTFLDLYPLRDSGVHHVPASIPSESEILHDLAYQRLHFIVRVAITDEGTAFSGIEKPDQFRALLKQAPALREFMADGGMQPLNLKTPELRTTMLKVAETDDVFPIPAKFKKPIPTKN